jgi:hypothetical protein
MTLSQRNVQVIMADPAIEGSGKQADHVCGLGALPIAPILN